MVDKGVVGINDLIQMLLTVPSELQSGVAHCVAHWTCEIINFDDVFLKPTCIQHASSIVKCAPRMVLSSPFIPQHTHAYGAYICHGECAREVQPPMCASDLGSDVCKQSSFCVKPHMAKRAITACFVESKLPIFNVPPVLLFLMN